MALSDRDYMRDEEPSWGGSGGLRWHWTATTALMAVITAVFLLQLAAEVYAEHYYDTVEHHADAVQIFRFLSLLPLSTAGLAHGYVWQLLTFQFLHAGLWHLLGNLLGLWFFGRAIESGLGRGNMLRLYFLSGITGGLLQALLGLLLPERLGGPVVGASAGVIGLFAAFAMFQPEAKILLWFVIPVSARQVFWFSLIVAVVFIVLPSSTTVANGAHLGGLLAGAAFVRWRLYAKSFREWLPVRAVNPSPTHEIRTYSFRPDYSPHPRPAPPEELPSDEFISREVDPILDKISMHGIQSLTDRERKILDAARKKMEKR
jgi:membrane associated rhomboid family serine protease